MPWISFVPIIAIVVVSGIKYIGRIIRHTNEIITDTTAKIVSLSFKVID